MAPPPSALPRGLAAALAHPKTAEPIHLADRRPTHDRRTKRVAVRPSPRRHAPQFTRAQLRNLRRLSGLTRPAKVLAWWRNQLALATTLRPAEKSAPAACATPGNAGH